MSSVQSCNKVLSEVFTERERQEQLKASGKFLWTCADLTYKVPSQAAYRGHVVDTEREVTVTHAERMAVLSEEVGEAAKEVVDFIIAGSKSDTNNAKIHLELLRKELVQVAAVAVAWIEALDAEQAASGKRQVESASPAATGG
jgi:hypothetical protein